MNTNISTSLGDKKLIILRGVSGCGKSTLAEFFGGVICCADDFFIKNGEYQFDPSQLHQAHEQCREKCLNAAKNGEKKIVVANTNTTEKEMKPYFDIAKEYGYMVFSLIVENRHNKRNVHHVPEEILYRQERRFEIKLR